MRKLEVFDLSSDLLTCGGGGAVDVVLERLGDGEVPLHGEHHRRVDGAEQRYVLHREQEVHEDDLKQR